MQNVLIRNMLASCQGFSASQITEGLPINRRLCELAVVGWTEPAMQHNDLDSSEVSSERLSRQPQLTTAQASFNLTLICLNSLTNTDF